MKDKNQRKRQTTGTNFAFFINKKILKRNIVNRIVFIGLGATWSVSDVSKGSTVAIFGLGTICKYLNLFLYHFYWLIEMSID